MQKCSFLQHTDKTGIPPGKPITGIPPV